MRVKTIHFIFKKIKIKKVYLPLITIGIIGGFVLLTHIGSLSSPNVSLENYTAKVLEKCSQESSAGDRRICYEKEVPKLMGDITLKDAFHITELIQDKDKEYAWCHNMGHQISEREYAKDPSQWKDVMAQCPIGTCSNGCLHGAIQAHFRTASVAGIQLKELISDLKTLCEERDNWRPTGLEQASCYHELGHFSLYLTNTNIQEAADICQIVGVKKDGRNFVRTCNEGIFMQVFEPREPEDFALIYKLIPNKNILPSCEQLEGEAKGACWATAWGGDARPFCANFEGETHSACMREAWIAYDKEVIQTAEGVLEYCSYSTEASEKKKCYNTLFYSLMSMFEFDENRMKKLCENLPLEVKGQCFANTASRMVETDKDLVARAVSVCEDAAKFNLAEQCFRELLYYASFSLHPNTKELTQFCNHFPNTQQKKCLGGNNHL